MMVRAAREESLKQRGDATYDERDGLAWRPRDLMAAPPDAPVNPRKDGHVGLRDVIREREYLLARDREQQEDEDDGDE